jgi:hypothetical protein
MSLPVNNRATYALSTDTAFENVDEPKKLKKIIIKLGLRN